MRFYAERPGRVGAQLLADVLVVGWVALCVAVARAAQALIDRLQVPGQALVDAGDAIRGTFDDAARTASGVPFVGDDLARALGAGTGAGESLAAAGREQIETVIVVALGTAVGILLVGALPVVLVWLTVRVRYARAARSAIAAPPPLLPPDPVPAERTALSSRPTGRECRSFARVGAVSR